MREIGTKVHWVDFYQFDTNSSHLEWETIVEELPPLNWPVGKSGGSFS